MEQIRFTRTKRAWSAWKRVPGWLRKPLILILGSVLLVTSPLIGWLPGPGGIAVLALAIAVLATEFTWAERLRHMIVAAIRTIAHWFMRRPRLAVALGVLGVVSFIVNISISLWIFVL